MLRTMRILVTGGTGTVGSQVVEALLARGVDVSVLTRDPAKAKLPARVALVQGNLTEVETVRRVFTDVDGVFLVNVVGPTESQEALLPLTAMRGSGVRHVVYLSVHHADKAAYLPHFGAKVGAEAGLAVSGLAYTVLRPDNFFQNDYMFKDAMLAYGVYPQPLGSVGTSRVDVRDIGEAAAIAFTTPGHEGQCYDIVGPDILTGPDCAGIWSDALGKPIAYGGDDLDAWEKVALTMLPDHLVFDFRHMYAHFQEQGLRATPAALDRLTTLLGRPPRSLRVFAEETAAAWSAA
jgi:uncharacterized protein YbjT (DUF2867 family)